MNEQTPGPLTAIGNLVLAQIPTELGRTAAVLAETASSSRAWRYACSPASFENEANACLLAAAYTAFDTAGRKLGIDAAALAERINLAALIQTAGTILDLAQVGADYTGQEIDQEMVISFRKVLTQARGF